MFKKLVIIETINILDMHIEKLNDIAEEVIYYKDLPANDDEIIKRIDDADAVLLSYTSSINSITFSVTSSIFIIEPIIINFFLLLSFSSILV